MWDRIRKGWENFWGSRRRRRQRARSTRRRHRTRRPGRTLAVYCPENTPSYGTFRRQGSPVSPLAALGVEEPTEQFFNRPSLQYPPLPTATYNPCIVSDHMVKECQLDRAGIPRSDRILPGMLEQPSKKADCDQLSGEIKTSAVEKADRRQRVMAARAAKALLSNAELKAKIQGGRGRRRRSRRRRRKGYGPIVPDGLMYSLLSRPSQYLGSLAMYGIGGSRRTRRRRYR